MNFVIYHLTIYHFLIYNGGIHDKHEVFGNEQVVSLLVQLCSRVLVRTRAIEIDLPRQLFTHKPLANGFSVLPPITQKIVLTRRLDTNQRLRLGPHIARFEQLDMRIFLLVDIDDADVTRRFEHVVELRRGDRRYREIRLHLRQTVHVCSHGLADLMRHLRHFGRHYQTLVDTTRSGGQQAFTRFAATRQNKRNKRKKKCFFHVFRYLRLQNYYFFMKNAKKMK